MTGRAAFRGSAGLLGDPGSPAAQLSAVGSLAKAPLTSSPHVDQHQGFRRGCLRQRCRMAQSLRLSAPRTTQRSVVGSRTSAPARSVATKIASDVCQEPCGPLRYAAWRVPMIEKAFRDAVSARVGDGDDLRTSLSVLCSACTEVTSLSASVVLLAQMHQQAAMEGSGVGAAVEDLQFTLGEGPGLDAFAEGTPVVVRDLEEAPSRWVHFASAARALGVIGVFAFPLQVGGITSGVLSLYRGVQDRVDEERLRDFAELASLVAESVLVMQSEASAEELSWALSSAAEHRTVVHQAAGMVSVQLDCSIEDAFVRLRATAFTEANTIDAVAREVVERRVRFEP
jgi:hypothetical protein